MKAVNIGIVGFSVPADCIAASVAAIPACYADSRAMLRDPAGELVSITAPNHVHVRITIDAAPMGKHVVCRAFGRVRRVQQRDKQREKLSGTHVDWFCDVADDEALCVHEFARGAAGVVEDSCNTVSGMIATIDVFGDTGQTSADRMRGNARPTHSEVGVRYAIETASSPRALERPIDRWKRPELAEAAL